MTRVVWCVGLHFTSCYDSKTLVKYYAPGGWPNTVLWPYGSPLAIAKTLESVSESAIIHSVLQYLSMNTLVHFQ